MSFSLSRRKSKKVVGGEVNYSRYFDRASSNALRGVLQRSIKQNLLERFSADMENIKLFRE